MRSPTAYWLSNKMKKPATTSASRRCTANPNTRMTNADPLSAATLLAPNTVAMIAMTAASTTTYEIPAASADTAVPR